MLKMTSSRVLWRQNMDSYNPIRFWQRYDDLTAKAISPLVKYEKVISPLVKYFTFDDIKTISLKNDSKFMQGM